jgi:hypothetical protein
LSAGILLSYVLDIWRWQPESLKKIHSIYWIVKPLDDWLFETGLTPMQLQKAITNLRAARSGFRPGLPAMRK